MKNLAWNDSVSANHRPGGHPVVEALFYGDAPSVRVEEGVTHGVTISFSDDVAVSLTPAAADALQDLIYAALVEVSA